MKNNDVNELLKHEIEKAEQDAIKIIESSKTREECYDRLVKWLGFENKLIEDICNIFYKDNYDT